MGWSFGSSILLYHRSGFHFPQPCSKRIRGLDRIEGTLFLAHEHGYTADFRFSDAVSSSSTRKYIDFLQDTLSKTLPPRWLTKPHGQRRPRSEILRTWSKQPNQALVPCRLVKFGCGSRIKSSCYAGFGPCFHLPGQPIWEYRFFEPDPNYCSGFTHLRARSSGKLPKPTNPRVPSKKDDTPVLRGLFGLPCRSPSLNLKNSEMEISALLLASI